MSREKQIEEMARISCNTNNSEIKWECAECPFNTVCDIQISCEALYNAGYRKQSEGEWKWISDDDCICSACGKVFYTADNADAGTGLWNFCPKCGAKMKGGEDNA